MNTYSKYKPKVYLAKCEGVHEKGDTILVTTRYGKENECIVHNLIKSDDEHNYYSITRADGFNTQEREPFRYRGGKYRMVKGTWLDNCFVAIELDQNGEETGEHKAFKLV